MQTPASQRIDDLEVLSSTAYVVKHARNVSIDQSQIATFAERLVDTSFSPPAWDSALHFADGTERTANYVLALDAVNFCFWPEPRWQVRYCGKTFDGYQALAATLKRAIEEGFPIYDAAYLATLDRAQMEHIFRGENQVPLLDQRLENLRQAGEVLLAKYEGQFARAIEAAAHSAVRLVRRIAADFPSFDDVARYEGRIVRLHKRAQICVADLYGSFEGRRWGSFDDLDRLTAFADYKLPQILRHLGILSYAPSLARKIDAKAPIPAGSPEEVEIRASTVWAVEHLRRATADRGLAVRAFELDWFLWNLSQQSGAMAPYHRIKTIFY